MNSGMSIGSEKGPKDSEWWPGMGEGGPRGDDRVRTDLHILYNVDVPDARSPMLHLLPSLLLNFVLGLADKQQSFLEPASLSPNPLQDVLEHHPALDAPGLDCPYAVRIIPF